MPTRIKRGRGVGRPSTFDWEWGLLLADWIRQGKPPEQFDKRKGGPPTPQQISNWRRLLPDFALAIDVARFLGNVESTGEDYAVLDEEFDAILDAMMYTRSPEERLPEVIFHDIADCVIQRASIFLVDEEAPAEVSQRALKMIKSAHRYKKEMETLEPP